jgi:glycerol-3-phosphate dehydrogenase
MGSTDLRCGDPDQVRCTEEEVDYMLETIRQVLPNLDIGRQHVVSRFTGVRPLRYSDASATVSVTRTHHCEVIEPSGDVGFPVYAMAGGKWTTFRSFAEEVADSLLARLHKRRRADSHDLPIGGGKGFPTKPEQRSRWLADLADKTGLAAERLDVLLTRYGTRAEQVAEFVAPGPDQPLRHHAGYTRREIEFLLARERVAHLDDLLLRRTHIALLGELTDGLFAELLALMAEARGWSRKETDAEGARVVEILQDRFGVLVRHPPEK